MVASRTMAMVRPTPITFRAVRLEAARARKTVTKTAAAAVIRPPVRCSPCATAWAVVAPARWASVIRDQGEQGPQAAAGAGHGVLLQALADGVQEGECCGLCDLAKNDRADRSDGHQGSHADLSLDQSPQRAGNERPGTQGQGNGIQPGDHALGAVVPSSEEPREQEHAGGRGEAQLADLPQPFGLVLFQPVAARFVAAGFVVAAAAGVAHRARSLSVVASVVSVSTVSTSAVLP